MKNELSMLDYLMTTSLLDLKQKIVVGDEQRYSFSKLKDLDSHIEMLRDEFIGRPELALYHAVITVLIRRKINLEENVQKFIQLWESEVDFLCTVLDSKWLKSACDTMIDYWENDIDRAFAISGALLTNTIKLYETERWATEKDTLTDYREVVGRIDLYDEIFAFAIGRGDMVGNMHRRIRSELDRNKESVGAKLDRASRFDTVFNRFKSLHQNPKTLW